ncbi:MAG: nucleotidyltransferase domain-containing protein [Myxococcales bacterium]|nr:nucleotidyltransferase domain-containing protein [Myxococcales bacterium]
MPPTIDIPPRVRRALDDLAGRLRAEFGARLRAVTLFGSAARGTYGPESDVDVLAVIAGLTDEDFARATRIASEAGLEWTLPVSLLPMSPEHFEHLRRTEQRLARDIEMEGVPL